MAIIFRVTLIGTYIGQTFNTVLNMQNTAAVLTGDQVAAEMRDNWVLWAKQYQSQKVIYNSIRVQPLTADNPAAVLLPINVIGGKASLVAEIPFVCGVAKIGTATGGRHGRGRIFFPGMGAWGIQDGLFAPTQLDAINTGLIAGLFQKFNGVNGTSPLTLGVMGRASNSTWHPMISLAMRAILGVQRRRNIGVGI